MTLAAVGGQHNSPSQMRGHSIPSQNQSITKKKLLYYVLNRKSTLGASVDLQRSNARYRRTWPSLTIKTIDSRRP